MPGAAKSPNQRGKLGRILFPLGFVMYLVVQVILKLRWMSVGAIILMPFIYFVPPLFSSGHQSLDGIEEAWAIGAQIIAILWLLFRAIPGTVRFVWREIRCAFGKLRTWRARRRLVRSVKEAREALADLGKKLDERDAKNRSASTVGEGR